MTACRSNYMADWARLWSVRDVIIDRTGLRPRLYPADGMICLVDHAEIPAVLMRCSGDCREDLLSLLDGLRNVTIGE